VLGIVQLDAVSLELLERLLGEGRLPALAALRARGRWYELETPATHFPAASYATLYTGMPIPEHGMYYAFQWAPEQQRIRWRGTFPQPTTCWERLAAAGKRSLVIDPYECEPPRVMNGVALSGWQVVNVMSLPRWSSPPSAQQELDRLFGAPESANEVFGAPTVRGLLKLRRCLLAATNRVADAAVHLLQRERFDLAWIDILSGHLGGHMFWNLSQIDAERLDAGTRHALEHTLEDIYESIDRSFGRIVAALSGADLIVTAPMGMGENIARVDLLPGMMEAVLNRNGSGGERRHSRAERFLWSMRAAIPTELRASVAIALHGPLTRELTMRMSAFGVDWKETPAFMLPSDHFGQIRLNVQGRERDGIVPPDAVDGLIDQIRQGLLSFRDPDGEPAVIAVDRTSEVLGPGKRDGSLPDLVVRWSNRPSGGVTHVTSEELGSTVRRPGSGSGRSGAHEPTGWALVVPASGVVVDTERPSVLDIVPTVCAAVGVETPDLPGSSLLAPSG
jgi:predicted AlkP superfamily phosphohydrolase/phosphomutase